MVGLADVSSVDLVRKFSTGSQLGENSYPVVITAQYECSLREEACLGHTWAIFSMFKTQVTLKLHCLNIPVTLAI